MRISVLHTSHPDAGAAYSMLSSLACGISSASHADGQQTCGIITEQRRHLNAIQGGASDQGQAKTRGTNKLRPSCKALVQGFSGRTPC